MPSAVPEPVIQFEDVCLSFGEECVLDGITFEVWRGDTLVIQGAAASGKTLILKLSLGLLRPTRGRIRLFGEDVTDFTDSQWNDVRARIGVLFQEGGLFDSLTVEENVAYPLLNQKRAPLSEEEVRRRVQESLDFVELGHTLEKYPSELSGGMRRRVGIARAIVTQPELLLYDSPTAGLDPITATTIMALIVKGRDVHHATTVMVTHRHQDGEILDRYRYDAATGRLVPAEPGTTRTRYMVLREGRIVFLGTPAEFDACEDPYVRKFSSR
ncbi:MAG: ATP-binding cassette domain-containing protein [Burkholderiaceae bacterium]|nr:ATP-binding cassette domain-containing protein [Burkholderiaceae bacterium]